VFLFLGLAKLVDMIAGINGIIINNSKYYKIDVFFSMLLAVLAVSSNFIFIQLYGTEGSALASLLSFLIYNLLKMWFLKSKLQLFPFKRNTLIAIALLGVVFWAGYLFRSFKWHWFVSATAKTTVISVLYLLGIWLLPVSQDLKNSIRKIIGK
jgi:peptidoglycan biosynthesis protein MviN/MurJ (putative lipid II flippase)